MVFLFYFLIFLFFLVLLFYFMILLFLIFFTGALAAVIDPFFRALVNFVVA